MARRIAVILLVVALASVSGFSRGALDRLTLSETLPDELLYLPNGKYLKVMSLGHRTLLADLIYLWAIQYYANYEGENRNRWVQHVFSDVIAELDPQYIDAYWLGALILILDVGDLEAGLALLDKGAERNPDNWILPYLAAWECYHAKQLERAAAYFQKAAAIPGAPTAVRRMRAGLLAKTGDLHQALAMWTSISQDPASDAVSKKIAARKIREAQTRLGMEAIQQAVERFRFDNGRWPSNLAELTGRSYLDSLPLDRDEHEFVYDSATGRVTSSSGLVLQGR